jgi:nickel transport protein
MHLRILYLRVVLCLLPAVLGAHEIEMSVSMAAPAVIVRSVYGGSDPVSFAKVQIFSPSQPSGEFQTGLTDRRGYFSFVPEGGGVWRVLVDDEEGHRAEVSVTVPESFRPNAQVSAAPSSRFERAVLGLAVIFGLTGILYGVKARRPA